MIKTSIYLGILGLFVTVIYASRTLPTTSFNLRANSQGSDGYIFSCRPADSINIDFIDPPPPPKNGNVYTQNVTIKRGDKINIVIGISTKNDSVAPLPNFALYKRLGASPNFRYEKVGSLKQSLKSTPWQNVYSVALTYDDIAEYLRDDSRDEARDYLQLNGQLNDPRAEPMLQAGTTACVARITLADRAPYVRPPTGNIKDDPTITPIPISSSPSPAITTSPVQRNPPDFIDTSSYWPKRGMSYLYQGFNYGEYSGGRNNPKTGRMQLDILPATLCGIEGDNYRFTKSNPYMYWTPCISGSCDQVSPNSEMVFAYEKYKTLKDPNTLISTMTLPFDTVVQPKEGIYGLKDKPFLRDDATSLSNMTYAAFTRKQYANMELNYPIVLKQPENYKHITQQPYDTVFTFDPTQQTKVGYPFLPQFFDRNNPSDADLGAENMFFMRTGERMGMCNIKNNLHSLVPVPGNGAPVPIPTRTDRPGINLFHTQYVNYAFFAKKKIELRGPNDRLIYSGYPLIVSMHEMYKSADCTLKGFNEGKCRHVLREDWYLAPNIGLVRLEQKYIDIYFKKPNQQPCATDPDCYGRSEMINPDYVMELINYGNTPEPANDPAYDQPYNIFDASVPSSFSPSPPTTQVTSTQPPPTSNQAQKTLLRHLFYIQAGSTGPSYPFMKTIVAIRNKFDYYCVKLPSKTACVQSIEDMCGIPPLRPDGSDRGIPRNYYRGQKLPDFCMSDVTRAAAMQDNCGGLKENKHQFITSSQESGISTPSNPYVGLFDYKCTYEPASIHINGKPYEVFGVTISIPNEFIPNWKEEYKYVWGNTVLPANTIVPIAGEGNLQFSFKDQGNPVRPRIINNDNVIDIKVVTIDP